MACLLFCVQQALLARVKTWQFEVKDAIVLVPGFDCAPPAYRLALQDLAQLQAPGACVELQVRTQSLTCHRCAQGRHVLTRACVTCAKRWHTERMPYALCHTNATLHSGQACSFQAYATSISLCSLWLYGLSAGEVRRIHTVCA